jgi:hypothetical protein
MDVSEDRVERGQIAVNVVQRRDPHDALLVLFVSGFGRLM